jgi:glucosylceramidase
MIVPSRRRLITGCAALAALATRAGAQQLQTYSPVGVGAGLTQPQGIVTPLDQSTPLASMSLPAMGAMTPDANTITVDSSTLLQPILGVGAALTGSAAFCLQNYLTSGQLTAFLTEMFETNGCQFVRIPFGSTDFENLSGPPYAFWTYDDVANDTSLANFSLGQHLTTLVPILQQILTINPNLQIIASIWSPPAWIKSGDSLTGGSITDNATNWTFLANYIVKAIQSFAAQGVPIAYVSFQNEPNSSTTSFPNSEYSAGGAYNTFIKTYLGPALASAGLSTKIIVAETFDWATTSFVNDAFADSSVAPLVGGMVWHAYGGDPSAVADEYTNHPGVTMMMDEWRSLLSASLAQDQTEMAQMLQGAFVAGCGAWVLWNMALDQSGNPSTVSTGRRGLVTINNTGSGITRNPEYYMLAHIGRYTRAGAKRSTSNTFGTGPSATDVQGFSWLNSDGWRGWFGFNPQATPRSLKLYDQQLAQGFSLTMNAGDMMTIAWPGP